MALTRNPTLSNDVIFNKVNHVDFMNYLNGCSILKNGKFKQNRRGDMYWNSDDKIGDDSLQHLTFHPGGSHNATGAIHFKYRIPELYNNTYNFRIYIVRSNGFDVRGRVYGRHVYIDDSALDVMYRDIVDIESKRLNANMSEYFNDQFNICDHMIESIGNCLSNYLYAANLTSYIRANFPNSSSSSLAGYRKKPQGKKTKGKKPRGKKMKQNKTKRNKK